MKDNLVLQNNLKVARAEKRFSQTDLSGIINVLRQTISSIKTNQYCASAKLAFVICIALDKTFEELFYFE